MNIITTTAGDLKFIDFALTYSNEWSDPTKRNQPVAAADIDQAFFCVKRDVADEFATLLLSTEDNEQMAFIGNKLRVKFGVNTENMLGDYLYALRLQFVAGGFLSIDEGSLVVLDNLLGD